MTHRFAPSLSSWFPWLACLLLPLSAEAAAVRYEVAPGAEGNRVVFESKAPMESFSGETDQVSGHAVLDPDALADSIVVSIEVDLASLDTGIELRNQHMRENHLETAKHPRAVFRGARVLGAPASLPMERAVETKVAGRLSLHGVEREMEAAVRWTRQGDGSLRIEAAFVVVLADFEISRPKFLFLKLDEKQEVTVDLVMRPEGGGREGQR